VSAAPDPARSLRGIDAVTLALAPTRADDAGQRARRAEVLGRLARHHRRRAAREIGPVARALLDTARELEAEAHRLLSVAPPERPLEVKPAS
jgi:hypothetical protein